MAEALSHMFKWMRDNDECFRRPPVSEALQQAAAVPPAADAEFIRKQEAINREMLEQIKKLSENMQFLVDTSKTVKQQIQSSYENIPVAEEKIKQIETRLHQNEAGLKNEDLERKLVQKLDEMEHKIIEISSKPAGSEGLTSTDMKFIEQKNNEVLLALEGVKENSLRASEKGNFNYKKIY